MPFLYPSLSTQASSWQKVARRAFRLVPPSRSAAVDENHDITRGSSHFNPDSHDYNRSLFTDKCTLTVHAGAGGNGCVSFLRDKHIADGPPNGGDGGTGGNVWIQAVDAETSLHKIARRRTVRAGRGKNGFGSSRGGQRGGDVLLEVPVGTVVREIARHDPVQIATTSQPPADDNAPDGTNIWSPDRSKWLLYPAAMPSSFTRTPFPALPHPRRSNLAPRQPRAPIRLDLAAPSPEPQLLAAGAVGGLGNPHFATKTVPRPPYATRGDAGLRLELSLELKLLADVALVGAPNAGKSTLLRALSSARARVGSWAFTTITPNIGTVVLDDHRGRARFDVVPSSGVGGGAGGPARRSRFTVADVPGLVPDAHRDRGLGLEFLRHVERARALAFVLDLAGDAEPVAALRALWRELDEFEKLQARRVHERTERRIVGWEQFGTAGDGMEGEAGHGEGLVAADGGGGGSVRWDPASAGRQPAEPLLPPLSAKPWFVVATKADVDGTRERFAALRDYLAAVASGNAPHPSGNENGWKGRLVAIPVSAIRGEGADGVIRHSMEILAGC